MKTHTAMRNTAELQLSLQSLHMEFRSSVDVIGFVVDGAAALHMHATHAQLDI